MTHLSPWSFENVRVHLTRPIGVSASATHEPISGSNAPSLPRPFFQTFFFASVISSISLPAIFKDLTNQLSESYPMPVGRHDAEFAEAPWFIGRSRRQLGPVRSEFGEYFIHIFDKCVGEI